MMRSARVLFLFGGLFAGVHVMSERIGGDESPSASRNQSLFPMRKDLHSGLWNEHAQLPEKRKVTRRAPRKASIVSYLLTGDLATSDSEHEELKLDEEDSTEHSMEDDNEHSRSENQEPTRTIEGFNKPFEVPDGLEVQEKGINVDYAFLENLSKIADGSVAESFVRTHDFDVYLANRARVPATGDWDGRPRALYFREVIHGDNSERGRERDFVEFMMTLWDSKELRCH